MCASASRLATGSTSGALQIDSLITLLRFIGRKWSTRFNNKCKPLSEISPISLVHLVIRKRNGNLSTRERRIRNFQTPQTVMPFSLSLRPGVTPSLFRNWAAPRALAFSTHRIRPGYPRGGDGWPLERNQKVLLMSTRRGTAQGRAADVPSYLSPFHRSSSGRFPLLREPQPTIRQSHTRNRA